MGARKAEPNLDPAAEQQVREWAEGEPEQLWRRAATRCSTLPPQRRGRSCSPRARSTPWRPRPRRGVPGCGRAPEVTDSLWPTQAPKTRPLMPLRRGHMAMLVAAGFLDNLCLEAGRAAASSSRAGPRRRTVLAEETDTAEVYRDRLRTTVVALDLDGGVITDIAA